MKISAIGLHVINNQEGLHIRRGLKKQVCVHSYSRIELVRSELGNSWWYIFVRFCTFCWQEFRCFENDNLHSRLAIIFLQCLAFIIVTAWHQHIWSWLVDCWVVYWGSTGPSYHGCGDLMYQDGAHVGRCGNMLRPSYLKHLFTVFMTSEAAGGEGKK